MTQELLPCAHCGAPGYLIADRKAGTFKVKCTGCELQTKASLYRAETITAWNTRTGDSERQAAAPVSQNELVEALAIAMRAARRARNSRNRIAYAPDAPMHGTELDDARACLPIIRSECDTRQAAAVEDMRVRTLEMAALGVERDADGKVQICTGCGSVQALDWIRASRPGTVSCCPERKMVPATYDWRYDRGFGLMRKDTCHSCGGKGWI